VSAEAQLARPQPTFRRAFEFAGSISIRKVAGVLVLAAAYYGAAKVGQTLRYTASVSAVWPPAGLGIAALYLWGIRWWPGIFIGEVIVNGELLFGENPLPLASLVGQQTGNMLEIIVGAVLLRRLIGSRAALDRIDQIGGLLLALCTATAISATAGTLSMLVGDVIQLSEAPNFWRTWWLGDTAGGLIVLPLALAWAGDPAAAWRRVRTWEGGLLIAAVVAIGAVAVSVDEPVTYMVFPTLIWAAFRFGPPGGTLAIAIAALVVIGFTANEVGPFFKQPIDHRTLSTQVYILVAALTTLFLGALVGEREDSAVELADARRKEGEQAAEERHRIARDLHDSVSQSLFSTALHARTAERALHQDGMDFSGRIGRDLRAIGELTRGAQSEMRALIFELKRDVPEGGWLVDALANHADRLGTREGLIIEVRGLKGRLPLSSRSETHLFGIGREALANVVKHAGASKAWVSIESRPGLIVVEIRDNGRGFNPEGSHPGHFGLDSMRSRAAELGGQLTIRSTPGYGTLVRVEAPTKAEEASHGA
jgi:signal transduction histidine kinase